MAVNRFDILFLCTDNNAKSKNGLEAVHKSGYNLLALVYEIPALRIDPKRPRELYEKPRWFRKNRLRQQSSSVYCHEHRIPYFVTHETNLEPLVSTLEAFEFDFVVVNGWPTKLPREIAAIARKEAINCHSSCLPEYRGGNITYAPLINREKTSGITVHVLTDKLDAGPIIAQRRFDLDRKETPGSLAIKRSLFIGEALLSALQRIKDGSPYSDNPPSEFWKRQSYLSFQAYRCINAIRWLFKRPPLRREPSPVRLIDRI
jgi:folate-dependent phosphoribosylglycinamide formyltransferase PurN